MIGEASEVTLSNTRQAAHQYNWVEKYINPDTRVVSFVREDARINVYYTDGTVVTLLRNGGQCRSVLMRMKCSLSLVCELFQNPRLHTTVNYYENIGKEKVFERRVGADLKDVIDDELAAVQSQLKSLDDEYIQIRIHRNKLVNRVKHLMAERTQARSNSSLKQKGESRSTCSGTESRASKLVDESEVDTKVQVREASARKEREEEVLKQRRLEEEKRRQAEIEQKKAAEEKRQQLEMELQQIAEKKNRVRLQEMKQKLGSELRRRKLEELRRQEEEDLQKVVHLQCARDDEQKKEALILEKLRNLKNEDNERDDKSDTDINQGRQDSEHFTEPASSESGSKQRDRITGNPTLRKESRRRGLYFASNAKLNEKAKQFLDGLRSNDDSADVEILLPAPNDGIVCTKSDGTVRWLGADYVHPQLISRLRDPRNVRPEVIAMDLRKRYYVQFAIGFRSSSFDFQSLVDFEDKRVSIFCFGQFHDTFFVKYKSGKMEWRNVPAKVDEILTQCQKTTSKSVKFLSLGPEGQFFIRLAGDDSRAGGLSTSDKKFLASIEGDIREVHFASDGLVVRYNREKDSEHESDDDSQFYLDEHECREKKLGVGVKRRQDTRIDSDEYGKEKKRRLAAALLSGRGSSLIHNMKSGLKHTVFFDNQKSEELACTDFLCVVGESYAVQIKTDGSAIFHGLRPKSILKVFASFKKKGPIKAFAFQSVNRFFVQWADGSHDGTPKLLESVKRKHVEFAALGPNESMFFKFRGNEMLYKNLPRRLLVLLEDVKKSILPPLEYLSLGPDSQWYVRLHSGTHKYCVKGEDHEFLKCVSGTVREVIFPFMGKKSRGLVIRYNEKQTK